MTTIDETVRPDQVPGVVREAVRLISPIAPGEVTGDQRLINDLGYHSLALAELGFTLEDLFGLDAVTPEQAMMMSQIDDIVALVERALADDRAGLPLRSDMQALCDRYGAVWPPAR